MSSTKLIDRKKAGARLRLVRLALGYTSKAKFSKKIGIQPPNYTRCEDGNALLTLDQYNYIHDTWGVDILYLTRGFEGLMPKLILERIDKIADAQKGED